MAIFKQQAKNQQRKKAKQEGIEAKQNALEAAQEAKEAFLQEQEERDAKREAVLELANEKREAKKLLAEATKNNKKKAVDNKNNSNAKGKKQTHEEASSPAVNTNEGGNATTALVPKLKHKQKVLLVSSRGINYRHRHLMNDLEALLPHSKKDAKLDTKSQLKLINELAEMANCNSCLFFEARKREDMYLWMAKTPNGPSVKFHMQNVHTMDELKMTGNCLKGTRHILSFDKTFDTQPHYQLMKEMFTQVFAVPRTSRRVKPFIDHIFSFTIADDRIWFRNYQIVESPPLEDAKKGLPKEDDVALVEIGPRFVLNPIRIFAGSFGGPTVYENPKFVSPSAARSLAKNLQATKYKSRVQAQADLREKIEENVLEEDPLDEVFR